MKKVITKRLMYRNMLTNEVLYGADEYDGEMPNWQILSSIYTLGKHEWIPNFCALYQLDKNGNIMYQIIVEEFRQYQKSWYDLFYDNVKRILRM